jgi:hypothetical protein
LVKEEVFGVWERGRYSEAIFGSHAAKDRMSASPPKTAEHSPPLKKGGQGGFPMKKGGRGGFLFSTSPPSPPLPDKASPSPLPFLPCFGHWNISVLVIVSDFEIRISNFLPKNRGFRSDTKYDR